MTELERVYEKTMHNWIAGTPFNSLDDELFSLSWGDLRHIAHALAQSDEVARAFIEERVSLDEEKLRILLEEFDDEDKYIELNYVDQWASFKCEDLSKALANAKGIIKCKADT